MDLTERLRLFGGVPLIRASREAADMLDTIDALVSGAHTGTAAGLAAAIIDVLHPDTTPPAA